jgi:hypothetical protein
MSYEENFIKYAGPGELKLLSRGFSEKISLHLTQKRIPFKVFEKSKSEVDGIVRLKGPASQAAIALAQIRKIIAVDGEDHRRYCHLEIEQIGPGEGERRVFGTKGPPRSESIPSKTATVKEPFFDADSEDADTYYPFLLSNLLDDPEPEVRLQFTEFGMLDDTVGQECEMEGNTLGCVMGEAIEKKKLVKEHAGTHPGGYFDNSEGGTVLFHFNSLKDAIRVAEYFGKVFTNKRMLKALFKSSGVEL